MRTTVILTSSVALAVALVAAAPQASRPTPAPATQSTASASAQAFNVDDVHSMALFGVHHLGAGRFWGRFNDVSGTFTCADGKPEGVAFDISIKTDSVDSGNEKLDAHLKSPDFFNAAAHPALHFKSTAVKQGSRAGWLDVAGELTMNGVTKPINATIEWTGTRAGPMGLRAGYEATFTVKRSDWGILYGVENKALGDDVRVVVALEGTAKE